jgi:hypothetical protein
MFRLRFTPLVGILLLGLLLTPGAALAHERRAVANGAYDVSVGWDVEPPSPNQANAATVRITRAATSPAQAVVGAESSLRLRVRYGSQQRELRLRADARQPGLYLADLTPSRAGDYQFTLVGSIEGQLVDATFDTADRQLEAVADVLFPDPAEQRSLIATAQAEAQTARQLALMAGAIALASLAAAIRPLVRRPRAASSTTPLRWPKEGAA